MLIPKTVCSGDAPTAIGPYSQAVQCGDMVFVSGQLGLDPESMTLVEGGVAEQTRQAMKNLRAILVAAGSSLRRTVKVRIYLADIADFAKVNEVYAEFMEAPYPARSCIAAAGLPKNALVEIEAISAVGNE
mgnify:CR=1 FL=1